MTDRTTKILLALIALALWLQLADTWIRPTPVQAQSSNIEIAGLLQSIDFKLGKIDKWVYEILIGCFQAKTCKEVK